MSEQNGGDRRRTWIAALATVACTLACIVAPAAAPVLAPLAAGAGYWLARRQEPRP